MSRPNSLTEQSRLDWVPSEGRTPTTEQIAVGALQRIATATEMMAKEHDRLERRAKAAESSREYWIAEHDAVRRKLIAARGQITKLKRQLATKQEPTP